MASIPNMEFQVELDAAVAEYIRNLERVAALADSCLNAWYEFDGDPSACGEYVDALHDGLQKIGDKKLSELKFRKAWRTAD